MEIARLSADLIIKVLRHKSYSCHVKLIMRTPLKIEVCIDWALKGSLQGSNTRLMTVLSLEKRDRVLDGVGSLSLLSSIS